MRVADAIVDFVAKACAKKVFILTGNGAMYINDAMQIHPEIEYVCVRNEAVAPLAASAYSQVSGEIGTVCVTAGPGAANAIPGVIEAWVDGIPILVISGQVPTLDKQDNSNNFEKNLRTFGIAGIPITQYVQEFTKTAFSLNDPREIKKAITRILDAIHIGRPGPIWIDIPLDVQSAWVEDIDIDLILETYLENLSELNSQIKNINSLEVELIEKKIKSSNRTLYIIGNGAKTGDNVNRLANWIDRNSIVFALTRPVAHIFPLSKKGNLGVLGVRGRPWSKKIFDSVDLIIGLGTRLPTSLVGSNYGYLKKDTDIILVNNEKVEMTKHKSRIINSTPMNVEDFIDLFEVKKLKTDEQNILSWFNEIKNIKKQLAIAHTAIENNPIDIYWFCENLEKKIDSDQILTSDAGSNYYACGQSMTFDTNFKELTSGTFAAMGVSVPLAIGAAAALSNRKRVICITGDGSIELNIQELQTISNYNLNLVIFVINNGGYASMRTWQDTFFDSRYIGSTDETGTKPMNLSKVANAFNLLYEQISNVDEFHSKIDSILESMNPMLVEVMCDSNQVLELPMNGDVV